MGACADGAVSDGGAGCAGTTGVCCVSTPGCGTATAGLALSGGGGATGATTGVTLSR